MANRAQKCKDCGGYGEPSQFWKCPTCKGTGAINRTGPYRLADGTWSDEVDRSVPLYGSDYNLRNPKRLAVTLVRDTGQWRAAIKRSRKGKRFDTHAEAIAYADRMAHTNQGENND